MNLLKYSVNTEINYEFSPLNFEEEIKLCNKITYRIKLRELCLKIFK